MPGDGERIEHAPAGVTDNRGPPVAIYAIVKLKDGTVVREVMSIAGQGQNAYQYDPQKGKNFAEWWRKTAIRRISKYIPRDSDRAGRHFHDAAERIDEDFGFSDGDGAPFSSLRGTGAQAFDDFLATKEQELASEQVRDEDLESSNRC
ncbi:MAG: recombinase RecT [Phycisphaerales bacterium]|nr:recombinase RecT [Phycisphaerales bacterium]